MEVRVEDDTVWLSQMQMAELFEATKQNISLHIRNVYKEGELDEKSTVKECLTVQTEGGRKVSRKVLFYNLDVIISVGYRVKSLRGTQFRKWANKVLKDYLLKGYAINNRMEKVEQDVFLIIDDRDIYHIGASLKDLGKRWFAFSKINIDPMDIIDKLT